MRTYIFTKYERELLQDYFSGGRKSETLRTLLRRCHNYEDALKRDLLMMGEVLKRTNPNA